MNRQSVTVIGAGWAGLMVATELARHWHDVIVVDRASVPGGVAQTKTRDGYLLEVAAASFTLPNPALSPIVSVAGVRTTPVLDPGATRWIYHNGQLTAAPTSPASLLQSPLLTAAAKTRLLTEPWMRREPMQGESLQQFLNRHFGREIGPLLGSVMAAGVFAGDPTRLSAAASFPALVEIERQYGSLLRGGISRMRARPKHGVRPRAFYPVGGMSAAAEQVASHLGARLQLQKEVTSLRRRGGTWQVGGVRSSDHVVLAMDPEAALPLLPAKLRSTLPAPQRAPVAVVGIGGPADDVPLPNGLGYLVAGGESNRARGVLFESWLAPGRAPASHHLARAIYGGAGHRDVLERSDADLAALAVDDLSASLSTDIQPSWTKVIRHAKGIPQLNVGHETAMEAFRDALAHYPGLHIAGWSYNGVGFSTLAKDAVDINRSISDGSS